MIVLVVPKSHHSLNLNHGSAHISPSAMVAHFVIYELAETKFAENNTIYSQYIQPYWLEQSGFFFFNMLTSENKKQIFAVQSDLLKVCS